MSSRLNGTLVSNSYNLRCVLYVVIKQRIPKLQDNEHYTF